MPNAINPPRPIKRAEKSFGACAVIVLLALAACSPAAPDQAVNRQNAAATGSSAAAADAGAATAAAPAVLPATAVAVEHSTPLYEFDYAYPAQAAAIAGLAGWLNADLARQKHQLIEQARAGQAEAASSGFDYHPYAKGARWAVVADLPGWLSLSAQRYEFSGGAHPNSWNEGLLWDKLAGRRLKSTDLFTTPAALSAAIRTPFCAALNRQRAAKRGGPVESGTSNLFVDCIDPVASAVILGSSDKAHFTRIGVLVDPYEAGPYAEGEYEVTLPVTPAVLRAVKPQYRSVFVAAR